MIGITLHQVVTRQLFASRWGMVHSQWALQEFILLPCAQRNTLLRSSLCLSQVRLTTTTSGAVVDLT